MIRYINCIFLLVLISCGKTEECTIKEDECYAFVNSTLEPYELRPKMVCENVDMERVKRGLHKIFNTPHIYFSPDDKDHILLQIEQAEGFKWDSKRLIKSTTVNDKETHDIIYSKKPKNDYNDPIRGVYFYSLPLFTLDKTRCIFAKSFSCGGLCGGGTVSLYQWTGSKWVKVFNFSNWVS